MSQALFYMLNHRFRLPPYQSERKRLEPTNAAAHTLQAKRMNQ